MKFGKPQFRKFGSDKGAYSIVTSREVIDSQITLTDFEAQLLVDYFGKENIRLGNVRGDPDLSEKTFLLYPHGNRIYLNLVFPKPRKTELRLYLSVEKGFKPAGGEVWFMFVKDNNLWIGSMSELQWRTESSILIVDETDHIYQNNLSYSDTIRVSKLGTRDIYVRSRDIALDKMKRVNYVCEFNPTHELFLSKATNNKYLEAHHLIPISLQNEFDISLDSATNVFCLCPNCHRAVHHAINPVSRNIIEKLSDKANVLSTYNLSLAELFSFYSVEDIE